MRRPKKDIQLTSYDELLGLEETPEKSMNQVVEIDLAKLYPFKNHPFHVNDDEGCIYEIFGGPMLGMLGLGFLYTNKNSVSIGLGVTLSDLIEKGIRPYDLLD